MKKWLYAAAGILIAIGFGILGRDARRAKKVSHQRDNLLLDKTRVSQEKAKRAGKKADKLQADAVKAAEAGKAAIDKVGSNDPTMAQVLSDWRSDSPDGM